ncbi:MAG TPA: amino acid ABC transporter permease, partial [Casimicrobiaceae bacterium]|nr:amino acid ABC transporter permease [Casimicrobiaceae bacterium]
YFSGLKMTLLLSVTTILLSLVIGAVGALLQGSPSMLLRLPVNAFVVVFRNTPPLVQLYFFYFGVGSLLRSSLASGNQPLVSNVTWAIISLSFFAGAFNVEIFRSGVEAVPKTTLEAAESLGFSRLRAYALIVLPLAFRISLPALNNNLVNLVKTTTLAYAIAVPEMLYVSSQIWSDELNVPVMMNVLLVCYFGLVGALVYVMNRWERAIQVPGFGQ